MKKTNLRINNFFIIHKDNSYYLTDIDVLDDWKETSDKDLEKFLKNKDCTEKINELKNLYDINSNVNFIIPDFKKFNVSLQKGGTKVIQLGGTTDNSPKRWQSGGDSSGSSPKSMWGGSNVKVYSWQTGGKSITQWGGWPPNNEELKEEEKSFF